MTSALKFSTFILLVISFILFNECSKAPQKIPKEFRNIIKQSQTPVEYREIYPSHGVQRLPIPEFITKQQALEDLAMLEYLFTTSYSGYEYWKYKGVEFDSYFENLKNYITSEDTTYTHEFEREISNILKQIRDGHINLLGIGYNHAYRHKSVYFCDILIEETDSGLFIVIDSQFDAVKKGDEFTQNNSEEYLFKTLSPYGKSHFLVGVLSYESIDSLELSFNHNMITVPFHGSRLIFAKFNDPEPFYIQRQNNIPVVRVTSFADKLFPQMKKFMSSANDLRNEKTIIVNLFYNGGGSSVFPQGFINNLNGTIQWKTSWATVRSPAITEYYAKYDLSSMPEISSGYRDLILTHKSLFEEYRNTPVKTWEFASTEKHNVSGTYKGKLIVLANRRVLSAGEGMVGVSRSVKNCIVIGENTGGSAQFSSTCGFYLPNSKLILNLPRQLIFVPGLEECVGYLPDFWLDTHEPVKEVIRWLDDPDNYQFEYSENYEEFTERIKLFPALPEDLQIYSPAPDLPDSLAVFSGKWFGVTDGVLDNMLVVEKIISTFEVEAIYSWGAAYQWNINQPGWRRYKGKFENANLILTDENSNLKMTFTPNPDGTINFIYDRPGVYSLTILRRVID